VSTTAAALIESLLIPFAAGFVIQRFIEVFDPLFPDSVKHPTAKRVATGIASLILAFLIVVSNDAFLLFARLGVANISHVEDVALTTVFVSAGTEGFNTLLKFAGYKKEVAKAEVAEKKTTLKQEKSTTTEEPVTPEAQLTLR